MGSNRSGGNRKKRIKRLRKHVEMMSEKAQFHWSTGALIRLKQANKALKQK